MTLDELREIESVLLNYLNSDSCVDTMSTDDVQQVLIIVEREIKLKTMDPRKHE